MPELVSNERVEVAVSEQDVGKLFGDEREFDGFGLRCFCCELRPVREIDDELVARFDGGLFESELG